MSKQERLNSFNFPQEIDRGLLVKLGERAAKIGSLRTAIAHQIEEEGLFFRNLLERFRKKYPDIITRRFSLDEVRIAVREYTRVGTIILETESAWQSGDNSHPVELLKNDPRGFSLLTWWVNFRLEELKHSLGKEERRGAIIGMTKGNKRFRQLYQALV